VIKSQKQSGFYEGVPYSKLVVDLVRTRSMFRGVVPGLARSLLANGCSMYVYALVKNQLTTVWK
jgi:hypothetical protein